MARTVAGRRGPDVASVNFVVDVIPYTQRPPYRDRTRACSFCIEPTTSGVRHDHCPGEIHTNPGRKDDKVWTCQCWKEDHPE